MALQQQEITYNLGIGGVDQKTDPKFAPLGRPTELTNVRFPKTGTIAKRFGITRASDSVGSWLPKRLIKTVSGLIAIARGVLSSAAGLRGWLTWVMAPDDVPTSSLGTFVQIAGIPPVPRAWVDKIAVNVAAADEIKAVTAAVGITQTCYVYHAVLGATSYLYSRVVDTASGNTLSETQITSVDPATRFFLFAVPGANSWALFFTQSGTNSYKPMLLSRFGIVDQANAITIHADKLWDVAIYGSTAIVAFKNAGGTSITLYKYAVTSSSITEGSNTGAVAVTTAPLHVAIMVPYTTTEDIVVVLQDATNGIRGITFSLTTLATVQALWIIKNDATYGTATLNKLTGVRMTNGEIQVVSEKNSATDYQTSVVVYDAIAIAATAANVGELLGLHLGSKPVIASASKRPMIVLAHLSRAGSGYGLQHARFLYELDHDSGSARTSTVVARFIRFGVQKPLTVMGITCLPAIAPFPADPSLYGSPVVEYLCPTVAVVTAPVDESGEREYRTIAAMRFNVHESAGYVAIQDGSTTLIQGGYLALYDGVGFSENGFLLYPEIISVTPSNGAGALPVNGTFKFVAVFVAVDGAGQVHRSAPSEVVTGTTGATDDTFTVTVRGLTPSARQIYGIELYRTEDKGTVFYLAEAKLELAPNATTAWSFTITGTDATLIASTPLGQQAGILDNEQPSCPVTISSNGRRVLAVPGDDRLSIVESKERVEGEGLAFFDGISRRITQDGEIIALENLGDRWTAWKKRRIYFATGEGADDAGQADTLSEFEPHPSIGVGVASCRDLVKTPFGIVFRSQRGYYLLESSGGIVPLGLGIDDYKDFPLTSAVFHEDRNEVHFLLRDGPRLVLSIHETEGGPSFRWSTDEDTQDADHYADIAVVENRIFAAPERRNGINAVELFVEKAGRYVDQDSYLTAMRFTTGWIPIAGRSQGRGRLYSAKFLGDAPGIHTARIRAAYDYRDAWIDVKTVTSANASSGDAPYQWEFRPKTRQKMQAVRFEFSEVLTEESRGAELSQLLLTVGVQPGSKTLRNSQRATAA
jgi:hypothetical protein